MKKLLFFLLFGLLMSSAAAAQRVGEGWVLVFQDEFDQPDGTAPDSAKWQACPRRNATWNRQIANSDSTVFVRDGALVCRALRNGDLAADSVPMLTGAIESRDLFAFTYGRVDVRLKTNLLAGNFPAAWMKPQPPCAPWPDSGEIDIFESIDSDPRAYHTVHTHWTRRLGRRHEPQSSFNEPVSVDSFHVYSIEWDSVSISWFVDGDWKGTTPNLPMKPPFLAANGPSTRPSTSCSIRASATARGPLRSTPISSTKPASTTCASTKNK